ncbi:MAG: FliM/FliN family flagellar motor switch protein [Dethiobacter sp.]|nr:FliM/FliN family flagellar motor switch protein [Dethiobacter sp.]MBS3897293.1 FliM/FliN family flagellar motor switch protein [Dethiobacter sp.]MBS3982311.1 FliM/FliN family flagellar motor switch protein [Dethiobacter sp.]MCL4463781.1 FliM/FliN family flagellar motor switch protein [Bacillota bacterium]MCL5992685.1 FliM/FliN family flagellar motor switch protein [Bacillota bacterium]
MSSFLSAKEIEELVKRLNPEEELKKNREEGELPAQTPVAELKKLPLQEVERVEFPELQKSPGGEKRREVAFFRVVPVNLALELGGVTLTVREILSLQKNSLIKLDKLAGENISLCVNGRPLASGEVVVINDNFAFRVAHLGEKSAEPEEKGQV